MYQQIGGIAMGNPLGAVIVNIFVGFQKEKLFEITDKLLHYARYVDNTFAIFLTETRRFFHSLNQLHPALKYTCEFENDDCLFLMS